MAAQSAVSGSTPNPAPHRSRPAAWPMRHDPAFVPATPPLPHSAPSRQAGPLPTPGSELVPCEGPRWPESDFALCSSDESWNLFQADSTARISMKGTLLRLNGRSYLSGSSWAANDATASAIFETVGFRNAPSGAIPYLKMANHAEPGTLLQAWIEGNKTGNGILFIDAVLCRTCARGNLAVMGRGLGLNSLEIWE